MVKSDNEFNKYYAEFITKIKSNFDVEKKINPDQIDGSVPMKNMRKQAHEDAMNNLKQKEIDGILKERNKRSNVILSCIVGMLVYSWIFMMYLGLGVLSFDGGTIVPAFIAQSIAQILGLGYIVTKFLFNKESMQK